VASASLMPVSTLVVLAGIVAKGLGVILALIGVGVLIGIFLTLFLTARVRRRRR